MTECDRYRKLMPPDPVPVQEYCRCGEVGAIYLAFVLAENPIHCDACRRLVAPEKIALTSLQVDALADWTTVFGSIYRLWLDSRSYETWAYLQLVDPGSAVNLDGMAVASLLAIGRSCGYLWFWSERRPCLCPRCASELLTMTNGFLSCATCRIYV